MVPIQIALSLLFTALAAGVVHADARRQSMAQSARRLWTAGIGLVSLGGSLAAFAFDDALARAHQLLAGEPVVVTSPRAWLVGLSLVGLTVSAVAVLAYWVGSRYGPLATA